MEKIRMKFWRCWLINYCLLAGILLGAVIGFQIYVDPFDVWSSEYKSGYNHIKLHLNDYDRVYKPYQYAQRKPDVVFLGNSRTKWGLPPVWPGVDDEKVYNFGSNGFRITEMEMYVDFMLKTHPPKVIVMGIGSLQFQKPNEHDPVQLQERLDMISLSPLAALLNKVKETCLSIDMVSKSFSTIEASKAKPYSKPIILRGWRYDDSQFHFPVMSRYTKSMWMYTRTYRNMSVDQIQLDAFDRLITKIKNAGIEFYVFFVPTPADLQLSTISRKGKWELEKKVKQKIVSNTAYWDFGYINSITINRKSYVDASHFRTAVGSMILNRITGHPISAYGNYTCPKDFGVKVTANNFEERMKWMKKRLTVFAEENRSFSVQLERTISSKKAFTSMLHQMVRN